MKKFILTVLAVLCSAFYAQSQNKEQAIDKFERYTQAKMYTVDNGDIVVSKVLENLPGTKDEIYARAKTFLARNYGSAKAVIQTDDKENGLIIIKGVYDELMRYQMNLWTVKAPHTIRIDIKDGRARMICNVEEMTPYSTSENDGLYTYYIVNCYPFTEKKNASLASKKLLAEAFIALIDRMHGSVYKIDEALREGGMLDVEKEDW